MLTAVRNLSARSRAFAAVLVTLVAGVAITVGGSPTTVRFSWYLGVSAVAAILIYAVMAPGRGTASADSDGSDA